MGRRRTILKLTSAHGRASTTPADSEYSRPNRVPFNSQGSNPVKVSFVNVNDQSGNGERVCFNVGRELYFYIYKGVRKGNGLTAAGWDSFDRFQSVYVNTAVNACATITCIVFKSCVQLKLHVNTPCIHRYPADPESRTRLNRSRDV